VRTTLVLGLAVVVAFVVGAVGVSVLTDEPGPSAQAPAGQSAGGLEERVEPTRTAPLPEATLEGFGGGTVELAAYRGRPLLVNFWASWCAPCVAEMPDFQDFADAHGDEVALLGVNVQDAPANARAFVEELGIDYDLAVDPQGELYADVEAFGMPTTLFVDDGGIIRYRHTGPLDLAELREAVEVHLGVPLPAG
jgi:cytochrome c biogenesis protein CcmG/thiol:disulfide interchange protein DsbE